MSLRGICHKLLSKLVRHAGHYTAYQLRYLADHHRHKQGQNKLIFSNVIDHVSVHSVVGFINYVDLHKMYSDGLYLDYLFSLMKSVLFICSMPATSLDTTIHLCIAMPKVTVTSRNDSRCIRYALSPTASLFMLFTLYWRERDSVSAEEHAPSVFRILTSYVEPP